MGEYYQNETGPIKVTLDAHRRAEDGEATKSKKKTPSKKKKVPVPGMSSRRSSTRVADTQAPEATTSAEEETQASSQIEQGQSISA